MSNKEQEYETNPTHQFIAHINNDGSVKFITKTENGVDRKLNETELSIFKQRIKYRDNPERQ